jgi:hypothetical protein
LKYPLGRLGESKARQQNAKEVAQGMSAEETFLYAGPAFIKTTKPGEVNSILE